MANEKSNFEQQMEQLGREIGTGFGKIEQQVNDYAQSEQGQRLKQQGKDLLKNGEKALNSLGEGIEKGFDELRGKKKD